METQHNPKANSTDDQTPELKALVAADTACEIVCQLLMIYGHDGADNQNDEADKKRSKGKFIIHIPIIHLPE